MRKSEVSAAKHTPGEWLIDGGDEKTFVYALNEQGYNRFSANVQTGHVAPMERTTVAELEANARLIAAAPELLAALQQLLPHYRTAVKLYDPNTDDAFTVFARTAIAKATGSAQ